MPYKKGESFVQSLDNHTQTNPAFLSNIEKKIPHFSKSSAFNL